MQFHHCLDQRKAKPRAGLRPALVKPHEALDDILALVGGDARPVVGDRKANAVRPAGNSFRLISPPVASPEYLIALSIRLKIAWPIRFAGCLGWICRVRCWMSAPDPGLIRNRLVKFGAVGNNRRKLDWRPLRGDRTRFHARDHQKRIEGSDQIDRIPEMIPSRARRR